MMASSFEDLLYRRRFRVTKQLLCKRRLQVVTQAATWCSASQCQSILRATMVSNPSYPVQVYGLWLLQGIDFRTASSSSLVSCCDLSLVLTFLGPSIQEAQVCLPAHRKDTAEHESILWCDESKAEGRHCWPQFQTV